MSTTHTPGPWLERSQGDSEYIYSEVHGAIATIPHGGLHRHEHKANARRIVECVNACKGIENPVEFMEVVKKLELDAYHKMKAERDELRKYIAEIAVVLTFQDNHKLAQKVRELLID